MLKRGTGIGRAADEQHYDGFLESLIELVTPPGESWELLQYRAIHQFVYRHLDDELLWATKCPASSTGTRGIPLAQFGSSM